MYVQVLKCEVAGSYEDTKEVDCISFGAANFREKFAIDYAGRQGTEGQVAGGGRERRGVWEF